MKVKYLYLIISFIVLVSLCGCKKNDLSVDKQVQDLIYLDTYDYPKEITEFWKMPENLAKLNELYNTNPVKAYFIAGNLSQAEGDLEAATDKYLKCLSYGNEHRDVDILAKTYYELAKIELFDENYEVANSYIDKIDFLFLNHSDKNVQIFIYTLWAYDVLEEPNGKQLAKDLMDKTYKIAEDINYDDIEYIIYMQGYVHSFMDNPLITCHYFTEALSIAEANKHEYRVAGISKDIGRIYLDEKNYQRAIEYMIKSYNSNQKYINESTNIVDHQNALFESVDILDYTFKCYHYMGDIEKCEEYITLEEEVLNSLVDCNQKEDALTNLYCSKGLYYSDLENYEEAFKNYQIALDRYNEATFFFYSNFDLYIYTLFGETYLKAKDYPQAEKYYKLIEEAFLEQGEVADINTLENLFNIYYKDGKDDLALEYANTLLTTYNYRNSQQEHQNAQFFLEEYQNDKNEKEIKALKIKNQQYTVQFFFVVAILIAVIFTGLYIFNQNKKIIALNRRLSSISNIDELTKLNNRRALDTYLKNNWQSIIADNANVSLAMIDIDFFKQFNDIYGHQAGDNTLYLIADIIKDVCSEEYFAARYGGEEFIIILPDTDAEKAYAILEYLCNKVTKEKIPHEGSNVSDYVTLSVGLTTSNLEKPYMTMIKEADDALYKAKEKRNCIIHYE